MEKKSIAKNYAYNLIYQLLAICLPLITTPFVSRVLGAECIGIYSYTVSIVIYFSLFGSLGIAMYGQREIAYIRDDKRQRSKIFAEIFLLRCITMLISLIIFYLSFVKGEIYQVYYKILILELIATCVDISWMFQGLEEFKKIVIRNSLIKLTSTILVFILIKSQNDLWKYVLIYVISNLLGNISMWVHLPKYIEKVKFKELNIFKHIKPTIALFIPQIAIQIYTVLDKVMIGTILIDKSQVGYYEQSQKIIKIFLTLITSLGTVMVPRMANTYIKGEKDKLNEYMKKSFNFVFFLSIPMIFGIISVSKEFVPIFFGDGYSEVIALMNIISPIVLMIGLSNVIGVQYLLPTKKQKEFTISVTVGAIINFVLNIILIKWHKALGASIATVIAETIVTIIQFYCIRKDIKIKDIFKISYKYLISGVVMFGIVILLEKIFVNIVGLAVVKIIVGAITYILTLIILRDEFLLSLINKIKEILKI